MADRPDRARHGRDRDVLKERLHQETGKIEPVGIGDARMVMARFENGALGLFEGTRYARGHKGAQGFGSKR